jgi:hypothetical protein
LAEVSGPLSSSQKSRVLAFHSAGVPPVRAPATRWPGYVGHYNNVRLNGAIGYIRPKDMLAGRQQEIHAERDRRLETARKQGQIRRQKVA